MTEPNNDAELDHAGVTIPPPVIFVGMLALTLGIDWAVAGPSFGLPFQARMIVAAIVLMAGLALLLVSAGMFRAAKTNLPPWQPTTVLVTSGIYRYTRNPMYLGMALAYMALSLFADSVIALLLLPIVLIILYYVAIRREEHYLEVKFGQPYRDYKKAVRRWL